MSVLSDAMVAVGLSADQRSPEFAERVEKYMADKGFYVEENWLQRENRQKEEAKAERQANQAAALAEAIPYTGVIKNCQASVYEQGRGASFHRCQKPARFVVRRVEQRHEKDGTKGDGRLASCRVHASDKGSRRHHRRWSYEMCATEVVEPEYQPPMKGETA